MNFDLSTLKIENWADLLPFYNNLNNRDISSEKELETWIKNRSDLGAIIDEDVAWRYIKMTCDTENEQIRTHFEKFVNEIQPEISKIENDLNIKFAKSPYFEKLDDNYTILKRSVKNEIELFREENVPIQAELETMTQNYGKITGAMTVHFNDKELTLQQAANFLKEPDRKIREAVYFLINERRYQNLDELNDLLTELIKKRHQIALNAGFENFRDYMHIERERFDYSVQDVLNFDESIKTQLMPVIEQLTIHRQKSLNLSELKPWDLDVDVSGKSALKPFETTTEFVDKTIKCFTKVRPKYGEFLKIMNENGFLDLESRKGKAPGGYNYPLMVSNIPFIFMNATSNVRDLETIVHEGGHAIHAFMAKDLELTEYKHTPSEIAELASMSMELISMEHWDVFFENSEDLKRAKIHQLEGVISVLPWVATIDKFQHWLYINPNHTIEERMKAWGKIHSKYSSKNIDRKDTEKFFFATWQKQLHIFEVPFYYIEYAISQLGAIAIWKNYKASPEETLNKYEKALSLGYSKPLPVLYETAGIKFDFSAEYIGELVEFVYSELKKLYK
ncbi:MAG: M3 family oligoendopeptidase [Bacteroidales bacterium]|nr:M3 family oligoendopeptidase [Bacteroidales bacterium]